jgi:hypothetical protein
VANLQLQYGSCYISTPAETTISGATTPTKAAGTTTELATNGFSHTDNRLTYTGTPTLKFVVNGLVSATKASGTSADIRYAIAKNGTIVTGCSVSRNTTSTAEGAMGFGGIITLATNDYVEIWVENLTNSDNLTVQEGSLTATIAG